jgi:hypothetical protein
MQQSCLLDRELDKMHASTQSPDPQRVELAQAFVEWETGFEQEIKEKFDLTPNCAIFYLCLSIGQQTAKAVLLCCEKHSESASDLSGKLYYVSEFITELYDALAPQDQAAAPRKNRHGPGFWTHVDLNYVCLRATKSYREQFLDRQSLKNLANAYLARPWLHNSFLDWILTDALIAAESVATYEWFQAQRGGVSYALFEGNKTKAALFRIFVAMPFVFFLSWIAPGLFCWWLYGAFPRVAVIIGALYYTVNIGWVIVYFVRLLLCRLRGGKSLRQRAAKLIPALYNAYQELRESTIHVPSLRNAVEQAKEKGVAWDPQLFCILDNVAQNHPSTWTARGVG